MDIKKIIAKLPTGFVEDAAGPRQGRPARRHRARRGGIRETEREQGQDEKLAGAREIVKDLAGAYNDAKARQRAKIAYALHLLEERGESGVGR